MAYHYGRFRQITDDDLGAGASMDETVALAIAARRSPRYACLHCGSATAVISVFCGTECRDACLESCGAGSSVGT